MRCGAVQVGCSIHTGRNATTCEGPAPSIESESASYPCGRRRDARCGMFDVAHSLTLLIMAVVALADIAFACTLGLGGQPRSSRNTHLPIQSSEETLGTQ